MGGGKTGAVDAALLPQTFERVIQSRKASFFFFSQDRENLNILKKKKNRENRLKELSLGVKKTKIKTTV